MSRVLVVSASMGAGHDAVAGELRRRLVMRGTSVEVVDWLALGGQRSGSLLRGFYAGMLRHVPRGYDLAMDGWERFPASFERVTTVGAALAPRRLAGLARGFDLVVATYNLAGQALGRLRRSGRVRVPVATLITDAGAHPYWWSSGVDLHVLPHPGAQIDGPWRSAVADPLVSAAFNDLSGGDRVVITGGAWGSGGVEATARVLARLHPVVLCGRDATLLARLSSVPGVEPRGWSDPVATLREARCLVDPAAGTSTWEALAAGVPVIAPARTLPGHGRRNVATLAAAGDVAWAASDADLVTLAARPVPSSWRPIGVDAVDVLLGKL